MQSSDQLLIASGFILGIVSIFAYFNAKVLFRNIKSTLLYRKAFKDEKQRLKGFKDSGGMHKWINDVAVRMPDGKLINTHACEHTGYCPAIDGFVPVQRIKQIILDRKLEEEYQAFKKEEKLKIQEYFSIADSDIDELVERILSLKKNFSLKKMNDFREEIKKQYGENVKIISDVSELEEVFKGLKNDKTK